MVLIGRLTKDAVVQQLKDERKVVNFTIAVNDSYKPKHSDKWVTNTTYITCAYWLSTKIAERLTKGSLVELTGHLSISAYADMQGNAKGSINCHVDKVTVHQHMRGDAKSETASPGNPQVKSEDLPF